MVKRKVRKATKRRSASYPTLKEHMMTRRRFLELTGGCLAAGTVWAACGRPLGGESEQEVEVPGDVEQPNYFTLRIPGEGEMTSYLYDGGMCVFYVELVTYEETVYSTLLDHPQEARDKCRTTIADFSYDQLDTGQGHTAAEDDLLDSLEVMARELTDAEGLTVEAVTLHIVSLEPHAPIDGGMPAPSYP